MQALALTAMLVLVVSCGGTPPPPPQPAAHIEVRVDPAITASGTMLVGKNPSTPRDGYESVVSAHRASDGALVIQVNTRSGESSFLSRISLHGTPGALAAEATAHPGTPCRGTIQVNHDGIADLTAEPLIVRGELTNWRSGSDVTESLAITITESDLR